jgi:type IV secretory pathway protease TraF
MKNIFSTVRNLFAGFALTLTMYAGVEAMLQAEWNHSASQAVGLSVCGQEANPCELAPMTVAPPAGKRLATAGDADAARPQVLGTAPVAPQPAAAIPMAES